MLKVKGKKLQIKSKCVVYAMAAFSAMSSFIIGYSGVVLSQTEHLLRDKNHLSIDEIGLSLTIAISAFNFGQIIGPLLYNFICERYGEAKAMIRCNMITITSILIQLISLNLQVLIAGRLLLGLTMGIISSIIPVYLHSISPLSISGKIGSINQLMIGFGLVAAYALGYLINDVDSKQDQIYWRLLLGFPILPCLLHIISLKCFFPFDKIERHIQKQQFHKIQQYLDVVYRNAKIQDIILQKIKQQNTLQKQDIIPLKQRITLSKTIDQEMILQKTIDQDVILQKIKEQDVILQKTKEQSGIDMFQQQKSDLKVMIPFQKIYLKQRSRYLLAIVVIASNQLAGINGIFYYAKQLFTEITDNNIQLSQNLMLALGCSQIMSTLICGRFIDVYGRKYLLLKGQILLFFVLSSIFIVDNLTGYLRDVLAHYIIIALIFIHVIIFNFSLGPICIVYAAQLVPDITPIVITLRVCSFLVALSSNFIIRSYGLGQMFLMYGVFTAISYAFLSQNMRETKGKSKPEIYEMFEREYHASEDEQQTALV